MWRYLRRSSAWCASRISRSPGRKIRVSPIGCSRAISSHAATMPSSTVRSPVVLALAFERAPAHFHRIAAAFDIHHRRVVEVRGEARGIDRRRGDDDLQVLAAFEQLLQIAEQEIDVEAALVRLVDDERVVGRQPAVGLDLGEQDAVGHELDRGLFADVVVEAHLETDRAAQRHLQFFGDAPRDRARGDAARLRAADHAGGAAPGGEAQLRQLRGLAGTGFARDHHHRVAADQFDDALGLGRDGQRVGSTGAAAAHAARSRARRPSAARAAAKRLARGVVAGLAFQRDHRPSRRPRSFDSAPSIARRACNDAPFAPVSIHSKTIGRINRGASNNRFPSQTPRPYCDRNPTRRSTNRMATPAKNPQGRPAASAARPRTSTSGSAPKTARRSPKT